MSKAAGLILSLAAAACPQAQVIYVDVDATGAETGANWTDAYTDLQSALAWATAGWEVWMAEGQYTPTDGSDRTISFVVPDGVQLYGGFNGTETIREERDWTLYESILSGDVGVSNDSTDNSYHVLVANGVGLTTIIDGVTIERGAARGGEPPDDRGAGIIAIGGSPTIRNTIFFRNIIGSPAGGLKPGGGLYAEDASPILEDCLFDGNRANRGGGIHFSGGIPVVRRVRFRHNSAGQLYFDNGSTGLFEDVIVEDADVTGVFIIGSSPHFIRTTIRNNTVQNSDGGGIRMSDGSAPIFEDCLIEGNTAGGWAGGVFSTDNSSPLFLHTIFRGNTSTASGGGAGLILGGEPAFIGCTLERNRGNGSGGALQVISSGVHILNSHFLGNTSTPNITAGGALLIFGEPVTGSANLANVVFVGNEGAQGGGLGAGDLDAGEATITNVVFAANEGRTSGGAIWSENAPGLEIHNAILWGNTAPLDNEIHVAEGGPPIVERAIVAGGYPSGIDILDQDPLFVRNPHPGPDGNWGTDDDDYGDLRLREGSPGIDYGLQSFLPADIWDLDGDGDTTERLPLDLNGEVRVQGAEVDLGPYEGAVIVANEPEAPGETAELRVYPNPASDFLFVYTDAGEVEILDVLGRVVLRSAVGERIDVSNLSNGVYVVRAAGESRVVSVRR